MALGGFGFGLSNLSTPILMGLMQDHFGIHRAFYVMGAIAMLWGLALMPMHRWAFRARTAHRERAAVVHHTRRVELLVLRSGRANILVRLFPRGLYDG